jgi:hypothetical protein
VRILYLGRETAMSTHPRRGGWAVAMLGLLAPFTSLSCGRSEPARTAVDPRAVLETLGSKSGLCVLLGVSEPDLAVRLARQSGLTVYVQSARAGQVREARRAAESAGLLGRRIFVDQAATDHILLADNLADAVVVVDPTPPGHRAAGR